jgi:hypothetical protein
MVSVGSFFTINTSILMNTSSLINKTQRKRIKAIRMEIIDLFSTSLLAMKREKTRNISMHPTSRIRKKSKMDIVVEYLTSR